MDPELESTVTSPPAPSEEPSTIIPPPPEHSDPDAPPAPGFTETCDYAGCGKSFTKATPGAAAQALNMHIGRKHKKNIPTYNPQVQLKKLSAKLARRTVKRRLANALKDRPIVRRGPHRKTRQLMARPILGSEASMAGPAPAPTQTSFKINHCPNCGFNIMKFALGMALANRQEAQ